MNAPTCDVIIWGEPCGQLADITLGLSYPCCGASFVRFRCTDCHGNVELTGTCRGCGERTTIVESEPVRLRATA